MELRIYEETHWGWKWCSRDDHWYRYPRWREEPRLQFRANSSFAWTDVHKEHFEYTEPKPKD